MQLELATREDIDIILNLYHSVLDTPYCRWDEHYPCIENIEDDLAREALFCYRDNDEIIAAISIDKDEDVDKLECWNKDLMPAMELSRLCVKQGCQAKGLAADMIRFMMEYGKQKGYKSVHYLVSKHNLIAQKAYKKLAFDLKGECQMYGDEYLCYEKEI